MHALPAKQYSKSPNIGKKRMSAIQSIFSPELPRPFIISKNASQSNPNMMIEPIPEME